MKKLTILATLGAALSLGVTGAALADHHGEKLADAFKTADKDNDGTLDKEEAKALPRVAKHFDAIDADKDGTVSMEEIHTFMKSKKGGKHGHDGMHDDKDGTAK